MIKSFRQHATILEFAETTFERFVIKVDPIRDKVIGRICTMAHGRRSFARLGCLHTTDSALSLFT